MSTWFPESRSDDDSPGQGDGAVRPSPGQRYANGYAEEPYPAPGGDSYELPTRRPQPPAGVLFEPAPPGLMFEPAATRDAGRDPGGDVGRDPGGDFGRDSERDAVRDFAPDPGRDYGRDRDRDPGRDLAPDPGRELARPVSPPGPARQSQETEFLPTGRPTGPDPGGFGDQGYSSRHPGPPSATPSFDVAASSGRRSAGKPASPPPPGTRGNRSAPLVPGTGAPLGGRPAPDYPDPVPGSGFPGPSRPGPGYADAPYADAPYADPAQSDQDQAYPDRPQYGDQRYGDEQQYGDQQQYGDSSYSGRAPTGRPPAGQPPHADPRPYGGQQPYPDQQRYPDQPYPDQPYPDQPYDGADDQQAAGTEAAQGRSRAADARSRLPGQSLSRLLAAVAWPVIAIGLFVPEAGSSAFGRIPAWSAFALACLVLVGVGAFGGAQGPGSGRTWTLGAVGACGLAVFWLLLVLPAISRNTSFALTLGVALAGAAVWLTPGRPRG